MKKHFYDAKVLRDAPDYVKEEYRSQGRDGAACGYVRKAPTTNKEEVTCAHCLRAMNLTPEKKTRTETLKELHDYHVNNNGHGY